MFRDTREYRAVFLCVTLAGERPTPLRPCVRMRRRCRQERSRRPGSGCQWCLVSAGCPLHRSWPAGPHPRSCRLPRTPSVSHPAPAPWAAPGRLGWLFMVLEPCALEPGASVGASVWLRLRQSEGRPCPGQRRGPGALLGSRGRLPPYAELSHLPLRVLVSAVLGPTSRELGGGTRPPVHLPGDPWSPGHACPGHVCGRFCQES